MSNTTSKPVTVYSTPTCQYCTLAKQYLASKGIAFSDYDVSTDKEKAMEMIKKSGQTGVPVLDINGRIIVGFDRGAIDSALSYGGPVDIRRNPMSFDLMDK